MASSNLAKIYTSFLDNQRADMWHSDASLHYITTLTTVTGSTDIEAHLKRQAGLYKIKEQKVLSTVESGNSLVFEVATTIEFESGGGAILPNLDDNFLADNTVTTPMIHFVKFDGDKVKQVRMYWDQSSLLKQISIIGKSGMNWPIRDGKDQITLIKASIEAGPVSTANSSRGSSPSRSQTSSSHGNRISLFAPRDAIVEEPTTTKAPKGSLKPHSRDLTAILAEAEEEEVRSKSPAKAGNVNGPKRTFFVGKTPEEEHSTPDRRYKSHPKKYEHFEFADPSDDPTPAPTPKPPKRVSVYGSKGPSWDFQDFTTPVQKPIKTRPQEDRHFGWSDDDQEPDSPVRHVTQPKPRKDAEHHFEFVDESPEKRPLSDIDQPLNRNGQLRQKNMSHFDIVDESPAAEKVKSNGNNVPESRKTVVKNMDAKWSNSSPSPGGIENKPIRSTGIKTTGDGMGGRKGQSKLWDFTDESSPIQNNYSENTRNKAKHGTQPSGGSFWDF